ncbi:carboxypeptidase [Erythrobacter sp. HI0063]|nr:carboxypeptidase [Erythrobacter sp. HI0063]
MPVRLVAVLFLMIAVWPVGPSRAQSVLEGSFDPGIPTLEQIAGHATGSDITSPEEIVAYFKALAEAAPERMKLVEYARSWEGRPLYYAVIGSAENIARREQIKAGMARLARGGEPEAQDGLVPVTWLSYGVHGDEISSSDAALALAYHLLAARGDPRVETILANSLVVIDPSQNPDGRNRFVQHYSQARGAVPIADPSAAEHDQQWPGGRFNHYLFDLNRDWFALTQPETRGKVAAIGEWKPVVLVDAHEMGGEETYFFPPSADPFNPNITATQREKQVLLGRNHAAWFDRIGQVYFTREVYDAFYPGYGDTWPTLKGAIASTFEQGSARGLVYRRRDGSEVTYAEGVRNHFIATLSTALTVAENAEAFLRDYAAYRRSARAERPGGSYVIDLGTRRWNAEALGRRLAAQGIETRRIVGPVTLCGRDYPSGALTVDRAQGDGRLIRSLLDESTALPADFVRRQEQRRERGQAHELYDTTAWSVGMMSGLAVSVCDAARGRGDILDASSPIAPMRSGNDADPFGVAVPWTDTGQARLVVAALAEGLVGRATADAFQSDGRTYPRGTVVFARGENAPGALRRLEELAQTIGAETVGLAQGWTQSGPNLGSASFVRLSNPRVALVWGDGTAPTSAGAWRYVVEQRLGLPVVPIRGDAIGRTILSDYDVVIVPDADPLSSLGGAGIAALRSYAGEGGVVVTVGGSTVGFAQGKEALFSTRRETVLGGTPRETGGEAEDGDEGGEFVAGEAIPDEAAYRAATIDQPAPPDELPGALVRTVADPDSYLSSGYEQGPIVVAEGSTVFRPLNKADGINVLRFAGPDRLVASGHVWDENRLQLAYKPYMMAQPVGRGLAIGFTHDPTTRGYLDGLDLLIANAVLFAPARTR